VPPRSESSVSTTGYGRRIWLGLLALLVSATPAAAAGVGSAPGGAAVEAEPGVAKVSCIAGCASRRRARTGSTIRITGRALEGVHKVRFAGATGRGDDAVVPVAAGSARLQLRVPAKAVTGPVVVHAGRVRSAPSRPVPILPPPPPEPNPVLSPVPGVPQLETGTSRTKAFVGARRAVTFSYRVGGSSPVPVRIELVNGADGSVPLTWTPGPAQPGQIHSVSWSGRLPDGAAAPGGRYWFRLVAETNGVVARSAQAPNPQRDAFDLFDHVFPIQAAHNYGQAGARFGAGRGGRSHQGHDVFARCGAPLVAARGGKVQYTGFHRAAGYYLVVDGDGTDVDYAYMHLAQPTPFRTGDRVYTGQRVGSVGDTGNARGCHLHFEMWNAPGWYEGGRPSDPLPALQAWDGWS
jgi:hypothetical protein